MESSGPFSEEYMDHSVNDTWNLITMATNSLRGELLRFSNASLDTAKRLAIFGTQCIRNQLTLTKTSLHDPNKWQFVELRSATVPVTWDERANIVPVFKLLATIQVK